MGSMPALTKVGERRVKNKKRSKQVLLSVNQINVFIPKTKKVQKADIVTVVESPANRNFIRRNIITKGSILDTKLGKVKVTSRPGQEGTLSGILIA